MYDETFLSSFLKSPGQVVRQRARRVERAGVQPNARWAERPRFHGGSRQHGFADSASHEAIGKTEVRDLDRTVVVFLELEEAGAAIVDEAFPDGYVRRGEMSGETLIGPRLAIMPVPLPSDDRVQAPIVIDANLMAAREAHRVVGERGCAKLLG